MKLRDLKKLIKESIAEILSESVAPGLSAYAEPLKYADDTNKIPNISSDKEIMEGSNDPADLKARMRTFTDEEMKQYMNKVLQKKGVEDKYRHPYIHGSNITKIAVEKDGKIVQEVDIEAFKRLISGRPNTIVSQNSKMMKTGGVEYEVFNTSLPALKGLIVNEKTNEFTIVDTCPSAGKCMTYCYAKSGSFVIFKAVSIRQTRILNYLFNDYEKYKSQLMAEISLLNTKTKNAGKKMLLRWNDSGDMLSDKYFEIVLDVARATPDVEHYAYTKEVSKIKSHPNIPSNFIFNFSKGGRPEQDKLIDPKTDKLSVVVPSNLSYPYISKEKSNADVVSKKKGGMAEPSKWKYNNSSDLLKFKNKLSDAYGIDVDSILSIEELINTPKSPNKKYNVIVLPGESDIAATRSDVLGTYLVIH